MRIALCLVALLTLATSTLAEAQNGYYRQPAVWNDTIVFVSEGDLWRVSTDGGTARRITTHPGYESLPHISSDGTRIAFTAEYEGASEVYSMPFNGGLPTRHTFQGDRCRTQGFTSDGDIVYATRKFSTRPLYHLVQLDPEDNTTELIPLIEAAEAAFAGNQLFFTRYSFQGSHTKRYKGGAAQSIWSFNLGNSAEAVPLTSDYAGTSRQPMVWQNRVYFLSDRDGTINLWSMDFDGGNLQQHTRHRDFEIRGASLSNGTVVYQCEADLWRYDIASGNSRRLVINLDSDFDQTREKWVTNPMSYLSSSHISPDGKRVALTSRGTVFTAPVKRGRLAQVTHEASVRYREAMFSHESDALYALADKSGEVEYWKLPANGVGEPEQVTKNGEVWRWGGTPSPNGKYIAHADKNQRLWISEVANGRSTLVETSEWGSYFDYSWSPDSQWLAFSSIADNTLSQIKLYQVGSGNILVATSDHYDSYSPAWGAEGKWLYFLSDRHFRSLVGSPWGSRQPDPFFDRQTEVFALDLAGGTPFPFTPPTEVTPEPSSDDEAEESEGPPPVTIARNGLMTRLHQVPASSGNYWGLMASADKLFWMALTDRHESAREVKVLSINNDDPEVETWAGGVNSAEMSQDGSAILLRKQSALYVASTGDGTATMDEKTQVMLSGWSFPIVPQDEWRQMFVDAWRLERDYFYDRGMHGVDWPAMRARYEPLVDRVRDREELDDIVEQLVAELSALHTYVYGGDHRGGPESVSIGSLGGVLSRSSRGYTVDHIYQSDPDRPELLSPLARPDVGVKVGDVVTHINGVSVLSAPNYQALLRNQVGKEVLLGVRSGGTSKDVIVKPISGGSERLLRYREWEYTRRLEVDDKGDGDLGYVHLRAMGSNDMAQFVRDFYPVFNRKGLILDVRNNNGGNIDSWILSKLMREPWFYWQPRVGGPSSNMQYAFHGHVVVLVNAKTYSDGEAIAEGIRRLGIGTIIGSRTWGGEIWLTSSNNMVDGGIATAAEFGVYTPDGEWIIEGHGVDPDIVVENLPHESFKGRDAQLEAAIEFLKKKIQEEPVVVPPAPAYPDKSLQR
ncbi:MAG: protease [Candidatus Eisenbacteria bacterium]|uniref:Tricorn protease homolog n=1 Tax=Eiseniibacteriota bacterium TaxID=2212470 RepID=A0A7Y2EGZ1_UNCEI|nr:protease [Candidatus Eisenbacteria bacterium]